MRVMTFNLRFENEVDGDNAWRLRRELVAGLIERYRPDLLGTQEGTASMLDWLAGRLEGYRLHAPANRVLDENSQYPSLFYRSDRFGLRAGQDRWLSETPEQHLSKGWDSAFPRMLSWARLAELDSGRELVAIVTHLDHIGPLARVNQARLVAGFAAGQPEPVLVMGDFNDTPGSATHDALTGESAALRDTWQALAQPEDLEQHTAHRFDGVGRKGRLDWILLDSGFEALAVEIVRDHAAGRWPSDHFPVLARLRWSTAGGGD
jgi:endonuclease/exonuclease/phosphatase family metal-dependent hydrolase